MNLDGMQAVALRLDDDSKHLHVLTMPVSAFTSKGGVKMCRELQPASTTPLCAEKPLKLIELFDQCEWTRYAV